MSISTVGLSKDLLQQRYSSDSPSYINKTFELQLKLSWHLHGRRHRTPSLRCKTLARKLRLSRSARSRAHVDFALVCLKRSI
jgi:hypothetical protein